MSESVAGSQTSAGQAGNLVDVTPQLLSGWPLPEPGKDTDKDERGRVLVVGGSAEIPGAAVLAAIGALRAGAGKLCVATASSVAAVVAQALPEARVIGLEESKQGGFAVGGARRLPLDFDAVLVGPGMQSEKETVAFTHALLSRFTRIKVVLDALAMSVVHAKDGLARLEAVITPHAGEMAHLSGYSKKDIQDDSWAAAMAAAKRFNAIVALKGATTYIAAPQGSSWRHEGGSSGLATSGSGDALAGLIVGLAARGASLEQSCVWGVALHGLAGQQLEKRFGPLGYLAREITREVPALMHKLGTKSE